MIVDFEALQYDHTSLFAGIASTDTRKEQYVLNTLDTYFTLVREQKNKK